MLVSSRFGQRVYNHVKRMEKSEYIILLERFLKGETTHDEERILVDWFKSDVSRNELRNYIQRKWEIASNSSIPTDLKERMFRKIQSRIESVAAEKKEVGRFSLRNIMRYAAIGLLVICAGLGGHLLTRYSRSVGVEKDYLVFAAKGQKASVVLPDGSKVWLNSDSEIKYTNLYGDGERIISLDGEAYFEVTKDSVRPFIVEVDRGFEVKVLGTHFNIKAYDTDDSYETTLVEGKVQVSQGHKTKITLEPSEQMVIGKDGRHEVRVVNTSYYTAWHEGWFYFNDESLEQVLTMIGRWYDVDFVFVKENLKEITVTGKLKRFENLSVILKMLERTTGTELMLKNRIVKVDKKK